MHKCYLVKFVPWRLYSLSILLNKFLFRLPHICVLKVICSIYDLFRDQKSNFCQSAKSAIKVQKSTKSAIWGNRLCTLISLVELCLLGCKTYVYYLVVRMGLSSGSSTVCAATAILSMLCSTVPNSSI